MPQEAKQIIVIIIIIIIIIIIQGETIKLSPLKRQHDSISV